MSYSPPLEAPTSPAELAVSIKGLSKTYRVYPRPWDRLLELLFKRPRHKAFRALEGLDLELPRGEALGIVGENGAGKSTLLKILAGVTAATAGELQIRGKVASILELGSGFHPDFTGRQNILLNAAMLGLSQSQVEEKTPDIIAFSELGDFIDQPVKTYSTGMSMRLGFAIATQVEPDLLIIDEALSVGDGYFQKKCMDRMVEYISSGGTLLFCSHAMYYVTSFCTRALWLKDGQVQALGPVDSVVRDYESFLLRKGQVEAEDRTESVGSGPARILKAGLKTERREDGLAIYRYREPWSLEIEWEAASEETEFHLAIGIDRIDGVQIAAFSTYHDRLPPFVGHLRYQITLDLPELPLLCGDFSVSVFLGDEEALHPYDTRLLRGAFQVDGTDFEVGLMRIKHRWQVSGGEAYPRTGYLEEGLAPARRLV
ncbi:MAG: ABC transporter ATP-binding protein [Deltaproteobacteria bacterium]|nr:ABC transporter ATP-binding protein [Deltaproteobacteria bacterium]